MLLLLIQLRNRAKVESLYTNPELSYLVPELPKVQPPIIELYMLQDEFDDIL